jgi:hypothetical protein
VINVPAVLQQVPHFRTLCSVSKLREMAEELRSDPRFRVTIAGHSANGFPIHHVQFGRGSVKAMFVGFPHCMEPIGGLTAFSLMRMLQAGCPELIATDVDWHIVPCIDPDGAMLNEGWSQHAFALERYMRHYYVQPMCGGQVDASFPVAYKKLVFDQPTQEVQVLKSIIDSVVPDFYYSLHNSWAGGGAWFLVRRDLGANYYRQLYALLEQYGLPLNPDPVHKHWVGEFSPGICRKVTIKDYYDHYERNTTLAPEEALKGVGASGPDYVLEKNEHALTFVSELTYIKHPLDGSREPTRESLRHLLLRLDAETRYLLTILVEEWEKVEKTLDRSSPFFRKIFCDLIAMKDRLPEALPWWVGSFGATTRDVMFNAAHGEPMTEGVRHFAYLLRKFSPLCHAYGFVRLLKSSEQTADVVKAIERLEPIFTESLGELSQSIDFDAFQVVDCDTLAKVQLGSGLIVLNKLLEQPVHDASR